MDTIEIVFDRAMDKASVIQAINIAPALAGQWIWPNARTVQFKPTTPLPANTNYTISVSRAAQATDGTPLRDHVRFVAQTQPAFGISQVIPAAGASNVAADSVVTVMFNRPVVALGAGARPNPLRISPNVAGTAEWLNTSVLVFRPAGPLPGGTQFNVTVGAGLTDTEGSVLPSAMSWAFTTTAPTVLDVTPWKDAQRMFLETVVQVRFDQAVDAASASVAFALLDGAGANVAGTKSVQGSNLVFTPTNRLAYDTRYTVKVMAGVKSIGGGVGSPHSFESQFTTVPLPKLLDVSSPTVIYPPEGFGALSLVFNTVVHTHDLEQHIRITPTASNLIAGVSGYSDSTRYFVNVNLRWQPDTDYTVEVLPGFTDVYSNATPTGKTIKFRTPAFPPSAGFDMGTPRAMLNAYLPARLSVTSINVNRLDLALYAVNLNEPRFWGELDFMIHNPAGYGTLTRTWQVAVANTPNRFVQTTVDLAANAHSLLPPGMYVLHMSAPGVSQFDLYWRSRVLLNVSRVNVTLKTEATETLIWATDLQSGQPIPNMRFDVHTVSQKQNAEATSTAPTTASVALSDNPETSSTANYDVRLVGTVQTSADGVARIAMPSYQRYNVVAQALPNATQGFAAMTTWSWANGNVLPLGGTLYTERPLYRAGQTVYLRGVIRTDDDARFGLLPAGSPVQLRVTDPTGQTIYDRASTTDAFGSYHADIPIKPDASLGNYYVTAQHGDRYGSYTTFRVGAYRPPEYETTLTTSADEVIQGEPLSATVSAYFLSSGPLVNANVVWFTQGKAFAFKPVGYDRYSFNDFSSAVDWGWPPLYAVGHSSQRPEQTNAAGQFTFAIPTSYTRNMVSHTVQLDLQVQVTGPDFQTATSKDSVIVHPTAQYVGVALRNPYLIEGESGVVDLVTVDTQGNRQPNQAVTLEVYKRIFFSYPQPYGYWNWSTRPPSDTLIYSATLTTGANAEASATFVPPDSNLYRVVARIQDAAGRSTQASQFAWVMGAGYAAWFGRDGVPLNLVTNKTSYVPGEAAQVLIPSPFTGTHYALVTTERGHIYKHEVVMLTSSRHTYTLPLTADHVPNIFVSAVLVKGMDVNAHQNAQLKLGSLKLTVLPVPQTLNITLTPDRTFLEPGQSITYTMLVRDSNSLPVVGVFSIDLVDKAVLNLSLRDDNAILRDFYGERGLGVNTASNVSALLGATVYPPTPAPPTSFTTPTPAAPAPTPAPGTEDRANNNTTGLRENFQDTAYWSPNTTTDATGQATIKVQLPDNTTTWVLRAVGVDAGTGSAMKVGVGTVPVTTSKPLIIRPAVPRFLVVGDEVALAALIQNNTAVEQQANAWLVSDAALHVSSPLTVAITIAPHDVATATWQARVLDAAQTNPIFRVASTNALFADAARPRLSTAPNGGLKILNYSAPDVVGTAGVLDGAGARAEAVALPPNLDTTQGNLAVRLDPSLIAAAQAGLGYLENYPYDSAETIMSSFLPNVLTYDVLKQFSQRDLMLEAKLNTLVRDGLDKLYNLQHHDGGWGWYREYTSNSHTTLYVLFGLARARRAGFAVRGDVIERASQYARSSIKPTHQLRSSFELDYQAYALYVLREADAAGLDPAMRDELFARRADLSHHGKALLALTYGLDNPSDAHITTLLADLNSAAILSATGAHWEESHTNFRAMNTDVRTTALVLWLLAKHDQGNALAANAMRWLMAVRLNNGYWRSTYETAWVLMALAEWARATGELSGNFAYSAHLNRVQIGAGVASANTISQSVVAIVPIANLKRAETNRLDILHGAGNGRLYYTAHLNAYLPVSSVSAVNRGIGVQRRFVRADCTLGVQCPAVTSAKLGEQLRVQLTLIAPHNLNYVQLEDVLPAGMEIVPAAEARNGEWGLEIGDSQSLPQSPVSSLSYPPFWWRWNWYTRVEFRDDRVALFANAVSAGTYEYSYVVRATSAGQFNVIPTFVTEQYFPEVFGRSDGALMTITR
jgi:hypothetical protein